MPGFLPLHVWQRSRNAIQHALEIDVNHAVPVVNLQTLKRGMRHQPGVVDHHVNPAVSCNRCLDQMLDLRSLRDVCLHGDGFFVAACQLRSQRVNTVKASRAKHNRGTTQGQVAGGGLAQAAAAQAPTQ